MSLPAKPTVIAHNQAAAPATSIPLSTLFTYSAASGDAIVGFDVEGTGNNGGYLTDNGVEQSAGRATSRRRQLHVRDFNQPDRTLGIRCRERTGPTRSSSTQPSAVCWRTRSKYR